MKKLTFITALFLSLCVALPSIAQKVATKYTKLSIVNDDDKRQTEYLALDLDVQILDCIQYIKFHYMKNNKQETVILPVTTSDYYMENGMIMCHKKLTPVKALSGTFSKRDMIDNISYEVVSKTGRIVHRDNLTAYYNMLYDSGSFPLTRR